MSAQCTLCFGQPTSSTLSQNTDSLILALLASKFHSRLKTFNIHLSYPPSLLYLLGEYFGFRSGFPFISLYQSFTLHRPMVKVELQGLWKTH